MTQTTYLTAQEKDQLKEKLHERRKTLMESMAAIEKEARQFRGEFEGEISNISADSGEHGAMNENYEVSIGLIERMSTELREIETAEERINSSSYGICQNCKTKIPKSRLMAAPEAQLCETCKESQERTEVSRRHVSQFER